LQLLAKILAAGLHRLGFLLHRGCGGFELLSGFELLGGVLQLAAESSDDFGLVSDFGSDLLVLLSQSRDFRVPVLAFGLPFRSGLLTSTQFRFSFRERRRFQRHALFEFFKLGTERVETLDFGAMPVDRFVLNGNLFLQFYDPLVFVAECRTEFFGLGAKLVGGQVNLAELGLVLRTHLVGVGEFGLQRFDLRFHLAQCGFCRHASVDGGLDSRGAFVELLQ